MKSSASSENYHMYFCSSFYCLPLIDRLKLMSQPHQEAYMGQVMEDSEPVKNVNPKNCFTLEKIKTKNDA
jgi:hypothetical protein